MLAFDCRTIPTATAEAPTAKMPIGPHPVIRTVEPGIYVVPALLARERGRDGVDWDRVDELHGFGGVRLEQNVLITDDGCETLTDYPYDL